MTTTARKIKTALMGRDVQETLDDLEARERAARLAAQTSTHKVLILGAGGAALS